MAWTFGGATADDITMTPAFGTGGNGHQSLTLGWYYPTTLTATRYYCSAANLYGMEVDGTTSAVRFRTLNATTNGQWTAPANVTVDKWWFLAFASHTTNTGPAAEFRLWVGDAENPPSEITVTNAIAPVGNFTAGVAFTAGNRGTGTLAFQGDIGWVSRITSQGAGNFLSFVTVGVISNDEANWVRDNWVIPMWLGRPRLSRGAGGLTNNFSIAHIPMDNGGSSYEFSSDAATPSTAGLTINGATYSLRSPPSIVPPDWPVDLYPYVRR